jgi:hypothetical protein
LREKVSPARATDEGSHLGRTVGDLSSAEKPFIRPLRGHLLPQGEKGF